MDEITVPSLSALRVKEVSPTQAQPKKGLTTFYFPERPTSKPVIGKITEANFV